MYRKQAQKKILVLGGYGFIGRHVVQRLRLLKHHVVIGSRNANGRKNTITMPFHNHVKTDELACLVRDYDAVINTVGILRQRFRQTYDQVHHRFVAELANACAGTNTRLVHISALGLNNPVRSRFLSSKRLGEGAIKRSGADWFIVRPSLIDGDGGYGARWFRKIAKLPIHVAPGNALGTLRPIHVLDLAEAIAKVALKDGVESRNREYDLGGARKMKIFEYLETLRAKPPILTLRIPAWFARLTSHVCDVFRVTPLSFGHYELLKFDNCPAHNRIHDLLVNPPRALGKLACHKGYGELHAA